MTLNCVSWTTSIQSSICTMQEHSAIRRFADQPTRPCWVHSINGTLFALAGTRSAYSHTNQKQQSSCDTCQRMQLLRRRTLLQLPTRVNAGGYSNKTRVAVFIKDTNAQAWVTYQIYTCILYIYILKIIILGLSLRHHS